jgi:SNF2 family DNA or RNA helicase
MPLTQQQQEAVDFLLAHNNRALVADSAGSGKTYQILTAILAQNGTLPVLIICIKPGLSVWQNELKKWYNKDSLIYTGTPKQRLELRNQIIDNTNGNCSFVITTYPLLKELTSILGFNFFKTLVLDEYHLTGLLNRKSLIYKQVKHLATIIPHIILCTGTPIRKDPSQYFTALQTLHPKPTESDSESFTSFWNFAYKYCIVNKEQFGYVIEKFPLNRQALAAMLSKYMIRRTLDDLPPKIRQPIPIEMTNKQQKAYKELTNEMVLERSENSLQPILTPNQMTKILRCRQLLVCPKILGIDDIGGGLETLIELVEDELSNDQPVIIFTPFTDAIPFIKEELQRIKGVEIYVIQGGMTVDQYRDVQESFQSNPSKNKVIICSIKSGASFTLTEATVCVFLGYDWDASTNEQAENRSWRKTQTSSVRCLYLLYKGSSDELVINRLNEKQMSLDVCLTPLEYYQKMLATADKL